MVERWPVYSATAKSSQACLAIRHCPDENARRAQVRIPTIIAQASRNYIALVVARQLRHEDVLAALAELFIDRRPPAHIRSENVREFIATVVPKWLGQISVSTLYLTPSAPWENGYDESFNGSLRDELLSREIIYNLAEAKVLIKA